MSVDKKISELPLVLSVSSNIILPAVDTTQLATNANFAISSDILALSAANTALSKISVNPGLLISANIVTGYPAISIDWTKVASVDSPALTGIPTTPTPPTNSDDGTIVNSEWVRDQGFATQAAVANLAETATVAGDISGTIASTTVSKLDGVPLMVDTSIPNSVLSFVGGRFTNIPNDNLTDGGNF